MITDSAETIFNHPQSWEVNDDQEARLEIKERGEKMKKKKSKRSSSRKSSAYDGIDDMPKDESESSDRKKKKKKKKKKRSSNMENSSSLLGGDECFFAGMSESNSSQGQGHDEERRQNRDSSGSFNYEETLNDVGSLWAARKTREPEILTPSEAPININRVEETALSGDEGDDIECGVAEFIRPTKHSLSPRSPTDVERDVESPPIGFDGDGQIPCPQIDNFCSSSVAVSMEHRGRFVSHSPKDERQIILDALASFAEASLGASMGGVLSHELLVTYMVSMGTPRDKAESLAFSCMSQQTIKRSHPQRSSSSRDVAHPPLLPKPTRQRSSIAHTPLTPQPDSPRQPAARSMTTSKLDHIRGMAAEQSPIGGSMRSIRDDISQSSSTARRPRNYVRADGPGAVEMDGRAFGAPIRLHSSLSSSRSLFADEPNIVVEALPVEQDQEMQFAHADSSPLSIKFLFSKGPIRRVVIAGLVLLAVAVGIICYFLLSGGGTPSVFEDESTLNPSSAPTFVLDEILKVAVEVSGLDALTAPNSPQFRAVGWLSTNDEVDHEGYGIPFIQRYTLVAFFFATNGEDWVEAERWLDPKIHECEWSLGISCFTDITKRLVVNGIDLTRNGLTGFLPKELGLLGQLKFLRLPKNSVAGTMPQSFSDLRKLSSLDVGSNKIHGQLPLEIGKATELATLVVSDNELSGMLPTSLWNLPRLKILDLSSNQLSGTIADSVHQLEKLATLDLRRNLFSGWLPRNLVGLENLDYVLLDYNRFTGSIPPLNAGFTTAQEISFSHNLLTGSLPDLEPASVFEMMATVRLSRLDISHNFITGTINPAVSFFPTLRSIDVSDNLFINEFPAQSGWNSIEELAAADNFFTGTISTVWSQGIRHFDMSGNLLTGTVPSDLCKFPNLEFLTLSRNQLEGTIPSCIADLDRLRAMEIASASLTGPIPDGIDQLRDLIIVDLSNNTLTGSLPSSIGRLIHLNQIFLNDNFLSSFIPSDLGKLTFLHKLHLANNAFTGSIPSSFAVLTNLESITLTGNALTGRVPDSLCEVSTIQLTAQAVGCDVECACCGDDKEVCG